MVLYGIQAPLCLTSLEHSIHCRAWRYVSLNQLTTWRHNINQSIADWWTIIRSLSFYRASLSLYTIVMVKINALHNGVSFTKDVLGRAGGYLGLKSIDQPISISKNCVNVSINKTLDTKITVVNHDYSLSYNHTHQNTRCSSTWVHNSKTGFTFQFYFLKKSSQPLVCNNVHNSCLFHLINIPQMIMDILC